MIVNVIVKGTVLLVLRKRLGMLKTTRDDLAWEIQEEVEEQVNALTGLNQDAKDLYRDENVFEDADIQMAGYAAALRVLKSPRKLPCKSPRKLRDCWGDWIRNERHKSLFLTPPAS